MQRVVKRQSRIDVCFLLKILYESEGITFMSCDDSLLHPVLLVRVCVCLCALHVVGATVWSTICLPMVSLFFPLFFFLALLYCLFAYSVCHFFFKTSRE